MNAKTTHDITFTETRRPAGLVTEPGANPERYARVVELRRSNAAAPHRNRRREQARGLGKGGRSGVKVALRNRSGAW